ncbi:MAG: MFS transporter [Thermoplasmata archaeon]|nr:MFS transporter [Thermoplasmata archaeon]
MTTATVSPERPSFRRALRSRPFLLLWLSQLISQSGDFVFEVALLWLVLEVTGSVFAVGLVVAVTLIPAVVLGPFLGVYIDRWDRRTILLLTNVAEGTVVAALSALLLTHAVGLSVILVIVFLLGTGGQLVRTTTGAMVPQVVSRDDLAPANSLQTFSGSLNQILGLSVGGVVVALFGVTLPIEYDAVSFFVAALIIAGVSRAYSHAADADPAGKNRFFTDFGEGIRFIRENRFMVELILLGIIVNFFGNAAAALFAPYAKLVLHGGAATYGFLGAAVAVGAILGAAVIGKVDTRRSAGKFLMGGGVGIGLVIAALGLTTYVPFAFVEILALGVVISITNIPLFVLVQAKVPGRLLGRVTAAFLSFIVASGPFGAFFAGSFAAATSVGLVFVISGLVVVVSMLLAVVLMKELRDVSY